MPNPMKGEAEVKLADGRTLRMAFDANAWCAIEEQLDKGTPEILEELQSGRARMKTQRAMMWGGLRKHHPEISVEEAGEILIEAAQQLSDAIEGGLPQAGEGAPAEGDVDPPQAPNDGAGKAS